MLNYENDKTEFKSTVTDKSMKEIVAFANTSGGTMYYGVEDSGRVIGNIRVAVSSGTRKPYARRVFTSGRVLPVFRLQKNA